MKRRARLANAVSRWLTILVPLSPVAVGWTYLLGRYYSNVYYGGIGVNIEYVNPNTTALLMSGALWQLSAVGIFLVFLIAMTVGLFALLLVTVVAAFAFGTLLHVGKILFKRKPESLKSSIRAAAGVLVPGADEAPPETFAEIWRGGKLRILTGLVAFAVLSFMTVTDIARDQVLSDIGRWSKMDDREMDEFVLTSDSGPIRIKGVLVTCGEHACAIWASDALRQIPRVAVLEMSTSREMILSRAKEEARRREQW